MAVNYVGLMEQVTTIAHCVTKNLWDDGHLHSSGTSLGTSPAESVTFQTVLREYPGQMSIITAPDVWNFSKGDGNEWTAMLANVSHSAIFCPVLSLRHTMRKDSLRLKLL